MLDAVLFKQPQHAIRIGGASHIDSVVGQFIHSGEIACEPVPVCHIETIAPCLEKGLTRFCSKAEYDIVALCIPASPSQGHAA